MTTTSLRALGLLAACALCAGAADAQTPTPPPASSSAQTTDTRDTRPATTTFFGDTGIWFVPTAEVTPDGKIAVTVYRRGTNYIQGYTNVGDLAGTFSVGIKNRAEIFGSFLADTRIDRDTRPLFFASDPSVGGIVDRYPGVHDQWTGDNVGDLYLGAKINLWSEYRRNPAAIAIRMMVKAPTGKSDVGTSTGKPDFSIDAIVSKEASKMVEVSAFGGYQWRGKPDGFTTPGGAFQWGAGLTFPSRNFIRAFAEVNGDVVSGDTATIISGVVQGTDHSFAPPIST
ncbi:MAG TPA: transporter, partial [Vicinamibacterales bacterium]|nr:transporter [Vicinamibacterales bacterium]